MSVDIAEKLSTIKNVVGSIEKQFGKGAIMSLGDEEAVDLPVIPLGSLAIDDALGIGGYPRGRIVEIFRFGVKWEDHPHFARHVRGPARRGGCGIHRCRARV